MSGVILDGEHGVAPMIPRCLFCGEAKNELVMLGRQVRRLAKAVNRTPEQVMREGVVMDDAPCDKCEANMSLGITFIEVDEAESMPGKPSLTGGYAVVKEEAVRDMIQPPELAEQIIRKRKALVPIQTMELLGLRRDVPLGEPT